MFRTVLAVVAAGVLASAAAGKDPEWKRYESEAGRYSASWPAKPKDDTKTVRTPAGDLKVVTKAASPESDLTLSVTYTDYPPNYADLDRERLLDAVRNGLKTKDARFLADCQGLGG